MKFAMRWKANRFLSRRARNAIAVGVLLLLGGAYLGWRQIAAPAELSIAVGTGDVKRVNLLLSCGADVNTQFDPDFEFPWGHADAEAMYGKDYRRRYSTALASAASRGDTRMAEMLLSRGADANEAGLDEGGEGGDSFILKSPLAWAALRGHLDIVQLLLQHGACPGTFQVSDFNDYTRTSPGERRQIMQMLQQAKK